MDPEDLLQIWSFDGGRIVRAVAPDFTYCLHDEDDQRNVSHLDIRGSSHLPGDLRAHYASSVLFWKRIA